MYSCCEIWDENITIGVGYHANRHESLRAEGTLNQLEHSGTIVLGSVCARIVQDPQGRQCAAITLADKEVLFTISQLLLLRELFDTSLKALTQYIPVDSPAPSEGEP